MATRSRRFALLTLVTAWMLVVPAPIQANVVTDSPVRLSQQGAPEGITLEYVRGSVHRGTAPNYVPYILIEWRVTEETQTLGYELWRGTDPNPNQAARLDPPGFIPAQNPGGGSSDYSWQDSYNLVPGTTYYYWLKSEADTGVWTTHTVPEFVPVVPFCSRYDINCSLTIDTTDITEVASSWNCDPLDVCYSERRDLNNDYIIDIRDIMPVGARWQCQFADACYW